MLLALGIATATAPVAGAADSASVRRVDWLTDRRVALWIDSPSMGATIQVQLLLARDWHIRPEARFPALYMLDGLRAQDTESGWTLDAGAEEFYADKNVNVVLPVGGQGSFYSDWLQPDNGRRYMWETFLTKELPPLLSDGWRTTDVRGVAGLSMGATSAMFLAARNEGFFKYAAAYSGFLSTTTLGMPEAIGFALRDAGNFDSHAMWGPKTGPEWPAHDPYVLADQLRGVSLYLSSGTGLAGQSDQVNGVPGVTTNLAGVGLEVLSRLTTENFATKLQKLGIPAEVRYRAAGTHTWPYWDFEMRQSWPQAAAALGVDAGKPSCGPDGAFGAALAVNAWLGDCVTGTYGVPGGTAQDFRFGRLISGATGTHAVAGRIGGAYYPAANALGLPLGPEQAAPDGRGRFQLFEHGAVYWTPQTGAHVVAGRIRDTWVQQGAERSPLGYPVSEQARIPNKPADVQGFEIGTMYSVDAAGTHAVLGKIMEKYAGLGYEESPLGFPKSEEMSIKDFGKFTEFEGGSIYWSPLTGAWSVRNGPIFDAWRAAGYENGRLGFPTGDQFDIAGGTQQNFQFGNIQLRDGQAAVLALP
nr:alpha/beta hydrolase-fold protein [Skermania piniformis]